MQRSLRGCLATLLYQLACARRGSLEALLRQNQEKLADLLKNGFSQGNLPDHDWVFVTQLVEGDRSIDNWSRKELSSAFQYVSNCTNARCRVFLDGLDECDQSHKSTTYSMPLENYSMFATSSSVFLAETNLIFGVYFTMCQS